MNGNLFEMLDSENTILYFTNLFMGIVVGDTGVNKKITKGLILQTRVGRHLMSKWTNKKNKTFQ